MGDFPDITPDMVLFAADLDGTLFHSHRQRRPGDVAVEVLHGRPQTFMSRDSVLLLKELQRHAVFVPVTSRSIVQYTRIIWPKGLTPRLAIVSNGGSLMVDGKLSSEWKRISEKMIRPYSAKIQQAFRSLMASGLATSGRIVDGAFAAAAYKDRWTAVRVYGEMVFPDGLWHARTGRKIFAGPPGMDKQTALRRLAERDGKLPRLIAAGDSVMDAGILQMADLALMPESMRGACGEQWERNRAGASNDFGTALLDEALRWCRTRSRPRMCVVLQG